MKKKIRVIRSEGKTIVIYSEPTKEKAAVPAMKQKPILVRVMGRRHHFIMPDGRTLPVREGRLWRLLKVLRPRAQFVAV